MDDVETFNLYKIYNGSKMFFYHENLLKIFNPIYKHNMTIEEDEKFITVKIIKNDIVLHEKIQVEMIDKTHEIYFIDFYNCNLGISLFKYQKHINIECIDSEHLKNYEALKSHFEKDHEYIKLFKSEIFSIDDILNEILDINNRVKHEEYEEVDSPWYEPKEFWIGFHYDRKIEETIECINEEYIKNKHVNLDLIYTYYCLLLIQQPFNILLYEKVYIKLKNDIASIK